MELIYTDNNYIEQGIIKDFDFDLAFGKDENDYEITTPENEMNEGYYWYIQDTKYGGVVDEIEGTTNQGMVTYRGRSFEGILASFSAWQLVSGNYIQVRDDTIDLNGTPNDITSEILDQLAIPIKLEVDIEQDIINETVDRGLDIYQLFRTAFEKNNYKVVTYFEGEICLSITGAIDYTSGNYFDVSRFTVKVDKKRVPNHLVGVFRRDEEENKIKHLYADEKGIIQPYYLLDSIHEQPKHDLEYERVQGTPVITGLNERVEVIEGGSKIENYDIVTELTDTDGNTEFENGIPKDWNEKCYTDYYHLKRDEETGELILDDKGEPQYENYEVETEDYFFTVYPYSRPDIEQKSVEWWNENWMTCFSNSGGEERQLSANDCTKTTVYRPHYWSITNKDYFRANYTDYYYLVSDPDTYSQIEGKPIYDWIKQTRKGEKWNSNTGEFYFDWVRRKWKVDEYNSKGKKKGSRWVYEYAQDGTPTPKSYNVYVKASSGSTEKKALNKYKQFNGGNISKTTKIYRSKNGKKSNGAGYIKVHPPVTAWSGRVSLETYSAVSGESMDSIKKNKWASGKYYLYEQVKTDPPDTLPQPIYSKDEVVSSTPPIVDDGTPIVYYYKEDKEKPVFEQGYTYKKVEDNYTNLVTKMLEEYDKILAEASIVEPQVDTDIGEFDVGDVIGSTHPFTNEQLTSKLTKKIVKGNSFKIEVSYEIG